MTKTSDNCLQVNCLERVLNGLSQFSLFACTFFFKPHLNFSLDASFVIFTGSSPREGIIITLRSQNGPSYLHCLTHALQSNEVKTISVRF